MQNATLLGAAIIMALFFTTPSHAEEVDLPIGVTLVKCGDTRADIPKACKLDERCCVFMDRVALAAGIEPKEEAMSYPGNKSYDIAAGTIQE